MRWIERNRQGQTRECWTENHDTIRGPWGDEPVGDLEVFDFDELAYLRDAMVANAPETLDKHGQWHCDQPTFGGEAPADTSKVWSWDEERLLVGTCAHDLEIIDR